MYVCRRRARATDGTRRREGPYSVDKAELGNKAVKVSDQKAWLVSSRHAVKGVEHAVNCPMPTQGKNMRGALIRNPSPTDKII